MGSSSVWDMMGSVAAFSASNRTRSWAACLSMSHTFSCSSSQMIYVRSTSPAMRQGASLGGSMVTCSGRDTVSCTASRTGSGFGVGGVMR